jgi:hypothetical protein
VAEADLAGAEAVVAVKVVESLAPLFRKSET